MSLTVNNFKTTPEETIINILSFLGVRDLNNCTLVDKLFHRLAEDLSLWKSLLQKWEIPAKLLENRHPKELLIRWTFYSEEQMLNSIDRSIKKIPYGERKTIQIHTVDLKGLFEINFGNNVECASFRDTPSQSFVLIQKIPGPFTPRQTPCDMVAISSPDKTFNVTFCCPKGYIKAQTDPSIVEKIVKVLQK